MQGPTDFEVEYPGPVLRPNVQEICKTFRDEEGHPRPLAFEQCVCCDCRRARVFLYTAGSELLIQLTGRAHADGRNDAVVDQRTARKRNARYLFDDAANPLAWCILVVRRINAEELQHASRSGDVRNSRKYVRECAAPVNRERERHRNGDNYGQYRREREAHVTQQGFPAKIKAKHSTSDKQDDLPWVLCLCRRERNCGRTAQGSRGDGAADRLSRWRIGDIA